jgi:hypothetical protein
MALQVELATPADDPAIRGLCRRETMPGHISLTYEREPDFSLGCRVTGDAFQVLVAREQHSGQIAGVACRSTRNIFFNGAPQRLGYLGQLRIGMQFRGRWLVSRGFAMLRQLHEQDPVPAYLVSIVEGNQEATEILVRKARKSSPSFQRIAELHSLAISVGRPKRDLQKDFSFSSASQDDLAEIANFLRKYGSRQQFFPVWTVDSLRELTSLGLSAENIRVLRRNGEIVALGAVWDQSGYKQTVLHSYSGWRKAAAPLYNLGAPWLGRPALPRPGEKLRSAYASLVCVASDDLGVFAALLRDLYNRAASHGFAYLLLGFDPRNPLFSVAKKYSHVLYPSHLYLASWPDGGQLHERLDGRFAHVDIATL